VNWFIDKLLARTKFTRKLLWWQWYQQRRMFWWELCLRNWGQACVDWSQEIQVINSWNKADVITRGQTTKEWSDENYNDNVWNSITRGYGIYTEGGSGVKVKLNLNTLSARFHERSWVHETLFEELWRKEHEQYCLTIIVFSYVWSHCITLCLVMCEVIV